MAVPRLSIWPPLAPGAHGRGAAERLPYPLEEDACRIFARGRHAILHGLRALGIGAGDEVLVPAYHHGAEVEAVIRTGAAPRFYEVDERLEPDLDQLRQLVGPKVRALHLTHFLGFPQDAARWRAWCDEHELLLVEDAAQAWLSTRGGVPVGSHGDLAIFCLYKTIGIPEGAALISRVPPPGPPIDPRWGVGEIARRHGAWLAQRSAAANVLTARLQRTAPLDAAREIDLGDLDAGVWGAVESLLPRLCDPGIAARRRAHYRYLLDVLADQVPEPFAELPAEASPFVFPIDADDKARLIERLRARGVLALNLWSAAHPSLPSEGFAGARRRRRRTVGLPVHQELRLADLERIVSATRPPARRSVELRLERLPGFEAAPERWRELAESAGNLFATREWLATWWRHFGRGDPLLLGCRRRDGSLAGIVPLHRSRIAGVRILRFLGHGPSDQLGPICHPSERALVARAVRRAGSQGLLGGWDMLVGEHLPAELGWSALIGGTVIRRDSSPVIRADGRSFDEILAARSANFRQQVRRRERKLRREHDLRFRLAGDPGQLDDAMSLLIDLHARRWRNGESTAFSPRRAAFHRDFARLALEQGWLRLWLAEIDGRAVAALYGLRFGGAELYYQSGRDPRWDSHAVGFVLLAHAVRAALEDGAREYRLLRGDEPYKLRFTDHDPGLETFVTGRRALGRMGIALASRLTESDSPRRWLRRAAGSSG